MTTIPAPTPYIPAHGGMCRIGPHLVCANYNAMPQHRWRTNYQDWRCEGCRTPMTCTFTPGDLVTRNYVNQTPSKNKLSITDG